MRAHRRLFLTALAFGIFSGAVASTQQPAASGRGIDNSSLLPKILSDDQVRMEGASPDWVKTLIMAEARIETAATQGTLSAATQVLDHYAEMGVNGLWIDPIYDRDNPQRNGYNNFGPQSIWPALTGTSDVDASFAQAKKFVTEAHRRNIRIFWDIIVWGTAKQSPLLTSHPEFYARRNGALVEVWGGYAFDWKNQSLRTWFKDAAVQLIEKTAADGFRVDLAPDTSGYFFKEIRDELYASGHKVVIISEAPSSRRDTFDFEQVGVTGWTERPDYAHPEILAKQKIKFGTHSEALFTNNIIDSIKSGMGIGEAKMQQAGLGGSFRFYTSNLLDHDDLAPFATGSRVRFAYSTIFAPFLPIWWIGEEWNNPGATTSVMYFANIDWSALARNRAFYEDLKRFIRIRLSYPEIFANFPPATRDANIAKLNTTVNGAPNPLQAYARFAGGKAILIVPNNSITDATFVVMPDLESLGMKRNARIRRTDLMTGQILSPRSKKEFAKPGFTANIAAGSLGVFLLE